MTQKEVTQADALSALNDIEYEYMKPEHKQRSIYKHLETLRQYIEGQGSVLYELLDKCFYINSTDGGIDWRYNELFVLYEDEPELSSKLLEFLNGHIPEGREGEE